MIRILIDALQKIRNKSTSLHLLAEESKDEFERTLNLKAHMMAGKWNFILIFTFIFIARTIEKYFEVPALYEFTDLFITFFVLMDCLVALFYWNGHNPGLIEE